MNLKEETANLEEDGVYVSIEEIAVSKEDSSLETASILCNKIVEFYGERVKSVILFGSRARGDHSESSDYDFLVLGDFEDMTVWDRQTSVSKHIGVLPLSVDILVLTEEEYTTHFLRDYIKEEGVLLYGGQSA